MLLLGTTGAGKTTLVRQLIGTDPSTERFPSTSTSKTTIHDTEIILDNGGWRAVVTFVSRHETKSYLDECICAAALEIVTNADDTKILHRLLNHVNQRFRFSYILGTGPKVTIPISDFDDEDEPRGQRVIDPAADELDAIDLSATTELIGLSVERLRDLVCQFRDQMRKELNPTDEEGAIIEELLEEELEPLLRDSEKFHEIVDSLMDEVEKRFDLLPPGTVTRTGQSWPLTWSGAWPLEKRREFLKSVSMFSSNYAPLYGRLLTPLVNGLRVAGPFSPKWSYGPTPKLVLFDGEGLGHTPDTSSSLSTGVSQLIETADAVVLVDNAAQPMLNGPQAAMRELVATGNGRKLILAFTHFDEVKGDNLPSVTEKVQHVLASAENFLSTFRQDHGVYGERILRERLRDARFFLADLQAPLSESTRAGRRTLKQLRELLRTIDQVIERPQPTVACPVYDHDNLVRAVHSAAEAFHTDWRIRLGLQEEPGSRKEHWARVKALNRRLAEMGKDEYASLRPVADLRQQLRDRIYVFIQKPLRWEGPQPSDGEKQTKYDTFADNLGARLRDLSTRRVWKEHIKAWQRAYQERGTGSTFVRARIIGNDIYESAAPVSKSTSLPGSNSFVREVVALVEDAAEAAGARFL
ncbi:MAG: hypothetical protein OXD34_08340 [bacterium]|nr:hypothetical protein [bacterium]